MNPAQDDSFHLNSAALATPFAYFDTQLKALLGVPGLPPTVSSSSPGISPWQLDSLLRYRSAENVRSSIDTTSSIVKLVDRIKGMPVGTAVRSDVESALDALEEVSPNQSKNFVSGILRVSADSSKRQERRSGHNSPSFRSSVRSLLRRILQPENGRHAILPR